MSNKVILDVKDLKVHFKLDEGLRHAVEVERFELVKSRMCEHRSSSPQWK